LDRSLSAYVPKPAHPDRKGQRIAGIKHRALTRRFLASIRGKDVADCIREREAEGVRANTLRLDLALRSRGFEGAATDWGMESSTNPVTRASKPKLPQGRTHRRNENAEGLLLTVFPAYFQVIITFCHRGGHAAQGNHIPKGITGIWPKGPPSSFELIL
jgi:hypothetical protein